MWNLCLDSNVFITRIFFLIYAANYDNAKGPNISTFIARLK
jgi:hypothetical protein